VTNEILAFDLLAELQRRSGDVVLDQVDFIACEDGTNIMGYFYDVSGECTLICFDKSRCSDPAALKRALMGSEGTQH
jgi:hypothetical protein